MVDCCNAQLQIPKRDILLSFEHKEIAHIVFITKMVHVMFHETASLSAVGNVSGYRCVSDCRSRGRKFDPGPVPYFRGD